MAIVKSPIERSQYASQIVVEFIQSVLLSDAPAKAKSPHVFEVIAITVIQFVTNGSVAPNLSPQTLTLIESEATGSLGQKVVSIASNAKLDVSKIRRNVNRWIRLSPYEKTHPSRAQFHRLMVKLSAKSKVMYSEPVKLDHHQKRQLSK